MGHGLSQAQHAGLSYRRDDRNRTRRKGKAERIRDGFEHLGLTGAALILGKNPKLTPDQVETIIERNTTDLGVPNYDTKFGWGLINSRAALAATP